MSFSVTSYWPLLLLLLVIPLWTVARTAQRQAPGSTKLLWLRSVTIALLVLALMQPVVTTKTRDLATALVLDVSGSMAPESIREGMEWVEEAASSLPGETVVIAAGRTPRVLESARELRTLEVSDGSIPTALDRSSTDLEAALRLAHGTLAEGRRRQVVLLSDGNQNRGHAREAAELLVSQGTPIHVRPQQSSAFDPWVQDATAIQASPGAGTASGTPLQLRTEVVSATSSTHSLKVTVDGVLQTEEAIQLSPGVNTVHLEVIASDAGVHRVDLSLDDGPPSYSLDLMSGSADRVLVVDGDGASAGFVRSMRRQGFDARLIDTETLPQADLDDFTSLVLSDVSADELPERLQERIAIWVERGGNLLLAAGPDVFGEEGYSGGALERSLPIEFNVEEERREVSLMIALDKSYSMKGEKMELAKEATKAALDVLEDEHRFGVVTFDWNPFDAVPLAEAVARDSMIEAIRRIEASAQTNFYPALESCLRQLSAVDSKVKHIILVSDGKTYPDDYESLLNRIRDEDITVSTVAVGLEADIELLRSIAEWGDGNSYFIQDASRVQKILIDEARGTIEDTVVEGDHTARVAHSSNALRDLDISQAPPLKGLITTKARESAVVLLDTKDDIPLLVVRNVGLGRSTVFTSDLKNRWAASWLSWKGFGPLFAQVLRSGLERAPTSQSQLLAEVEGNQVTLSADLLGSEGQRLSAAQATAVVVSPDGQQRAVPLRLVAPGSYRARLEQPEDPGVYRVELQQDGSPSAWTSFFRPPSSEQRSAPSRTDLLSQLSNMTGGLTDPTVEQLSESIGEGQPRERSLWPWLAALGFLLYIVDILLRRWGLFNRLAARRGITGNPSTSLSPGESTPIV